jgi:hypothetical protein
MPASVRLDWNHWRGFRQRIAVFQGRALASLPALRELPAPDPCDFSVKVTLGLPIPQAQDPVVGVRAEYLYFAANFPKLRVANTSAGWFLLIDTHREASAQRYEWEVAGEVINTLSGADLCIPSAEEMAWLRAHHPDFPKCDPVALQARLAEHRQAQ